MMSGMYYKGKDLFPDFPHIQKLLQENEANLIKELTIKLVGTKQIHNVTRTQLPLDIYVIENKTEQNQQTTKSPLNQNQINPHKNKTHHQQMNSHTPPNPIKHCKN